MRNDRFIFLMIGVLSFVFPMSLFSQVSSSLKEASQGHKIESKALSHDRTHLVASVMQFYTRLFLHAPKAFYPYQSMHALNQKNTFRYVIKHLCQGELDSFCKTYKTQLRTSYQTMMSKQSLAELQKDNTLQRVVLELTPLYREFQDRYKQLKQDYYEHVTVILKQRDLGFDLFQHQLDSLLENEFSRRFEALVEDFYVKTAFVPAVLLQSHYMIDFIKGGFYQLEPIDLIHSVKSLTQQVKQTILSRLKGQTLVEDDKDSLSFFRTEKTVKQWFNGQTVLGKEEWSYLKTYHNDDPKLVELLMEKKYQRALWRLRSVHAFKKANTLERELVVSAFSPKNCTSILPLGMGFTRTLKADFSLGIRGIYKPDISFYRHPLEKITANYKMEIAAYEVDKLLNLNLVPLTFFAKYEDEKRGSIQYFVDDAYRAREMRTYNRNRPRKFDTPLGRSVKTSNMIFFDWLMSNYDRNVDNYLFLSNGQRVLIDHGFIFINRLLSKKNLTRHQLLQRVPSKEIFQNLKQLRKSPEFFSENVKPWLSHNQVILMIDKLNYFVDKTTQLIRLMGEEKVFSRSEREKEASIEIY